MSRARSSLREAKALGVAGSALLLLGSLMLLSLLAAASGVISIVVGLLCIGLALKRLSDASGRPRILRDFLAGVAVGAAGAVTALSLGLATLIDIAKHDRSLSIIAAASAAAAALVALWLSLSVSGWLLKKSLDGAAAATGVKLFSTAGLLYFIGALLVVTLIGAPIIVAATVLALAAFLSMPMEVERAEESGPRAEP
ncbi:MAG: DUF996 domain-containing protein [Fervidicoccaceae archaeon]